MHLIAITIVAAVVLSGALGVALMYRQAASVAAQRESVPVEFAGQVSLEEHKRAAAYTLARTRVAIVQTVFDAVVALLWLTVLLGPLYGWVAQFVAPGISRSIAVVVAFGLIEQLLHLPFSIFRNVSLEAKFGFNRMTP